MDIRQLTYFIAVAEAKNYSRAAKSLFVTQPTLSQSIKKLEAELNTILFLQNGRQLALTEAGEILYEKGQLLMTNVNQMVTEIQQLNQEKKEGIRVGLTSLFAIQFMKQISTFMATHSNVEVSLIQDGSRKLQELLAKGKIDIGLLSFPSTRNDITIEPLQTSTKGYKVSIVMPKSHPLATLPEIELNDLRDYKVASLNEHYMLGEMLPRKCRALGFDPISSLNTMTGKFLFIVYKTSMQSLFYQVNLKALAKFKIYAGSHLRIKIIFIRLVLLTEMILLLVL